MFIEFLTSHRLPATGNFVKRFDWLFAIGMFILLFKFLNRFKGQAITAFQKKKLNSCMRRMVLLW
jgi:hypothetical protein